ncbi:acetolactate synthase [Microbacterium esteraromaticum]|uniref:Acetolactate synthase n=1 Tax=Microbacterium esteraromaticum TaxID=57043 RepID=A0A7D8A679_9MICO|nr:thiamine pyrophosphate-dependent enzyme [Microbacterium esteraromaticum]QMU95920.1 acetolactate synthase [Microbacterium esteraromaticum]
MSMTVGRIIVEAIRAEGVDHVFCVPGESYLPVLDAFNDVPGITLVTTHHEEGAGFMADAWARTRGLPGVFMVTRGPGVTHAAIALHAARQDSTPLVLLVGQVPKEDEGRESFQEMDLLALGDLIGKGAVKITEGDRAAEQIQRAFYLARAGRPGPVVVSLPEDVGYDTTETVEVARQRVPRPAASDSDVAEAVDLLRSADAPAFVIGGGCGDERMREDLIALAEASGAVVYCGWRRFDAFPNGHAQFAGNLPWLPEELLAPLRRADLVIGIGTRMGDFSSLGYTVPGAGQRFVQIDLSAESMSPVRNPDLPIVGDAGDTVARLLAALRDAPLASEVLDGRRQSARRAHLAYVASTEPESATGDDFDIPRAIAELRKELSGDAVITSDAGAFASYLNRYYRWERPKTFLGTTSGSMGYAVPSAIGAKFADPARRVLAVAGDGGFAMTMSEVHTAVRLGLDRLVFLVFDNATYGTIRAHQTRVFPGREIGVDQASMDLIAVAEGMGAAAHRVRTNEEFLPALRSALAAGRPAVIQVHTSPSQIGAWS